MYYQQGDILIKKTTEIKGELLNHLTLAKGEATGHHHTITKGTAKLYDDNGTLYLSVKEEAQLTHQEHNVVTLPVGDYVVELVKEYDHFSEEIRNVND